MSPQHTLHHPRWHRQRMSIFWWTERWPYARFIARELTSVFVAAYAVLTLAMASGIAGEGGWQRWLALLSRPGMVALHAVLLAAVCFHAVTWFNLAPRAIVLRVGGRRLPDAVVAGANYAGWLAVSAVLAWIVLGGAR